MNNNFIVQLLIYGETTTLHSLSYLSDILLTSECVLLCSLRSSVARILLQGGTDVWCTGCEVRGDKVIQK